MYNKYFINITSFVFACLITGLVIIFMQKFSIRTSKIETNKEEVINLNSTVVSQENLIEQNNVKEIAIENTITSDEKKENQGVVWQLMIPKIDLIAPITEGTEQATLSKTIGHFTETSNWDGNVGLASHNRGNRANFFENIKSLVKNDLIIYQKGDNAKHYQVETVTVIQDNDWSYLQPTTDNRITLITCIKNQPNYRLCIQALEVI